MTRVKAPTGTEAYQPPGSASGSRGYDANGSLYDSEHGWLVGVLARASLPGPARFLAGGKNRTALLSAQGLPGGTVAGFRCSGGTACATVSASPLLDCDIHSAADGQAPTGVLAGYLGFVQRNAVPDEQGKWDHNIGQNYDRSLY